MHIFHSKRKSYFCFHIIAKVVRALKVVFFGICAAFVYIIWLAGAPDNTRAALRCLFLLTINLSDQFALSLSHLFDALLVQRELLLFSFLSCQQSQWCFRLLWRAPLEPVPTAPEPATLPLAPIICTLVCFWPYPLIYADCLFWACPGAEWCCCTFNCWVLWKARSGTW